MFRPDAQRKSQEEIDKEEINRQPISVFINDTQTANFKCEKVVRTQEPFSEFSQLFYHITTTVSAVTNHYICTNKPMAGPKVDGNSTKAKIYDLKCKIFGYSPSLFENNIDFGLNSQKTDSFLLFLLKLHLNVSRQLAMTDDQPNTRLTTS